MNFETGPQIIEHVGGRAPQASGRCAGHGKELPFSGNIFPALACSNDRGTMRNSSEHTDRNVAT
ncbi:hypothetical protein [Pseudooceanicola sp.]|uniref:hypothetical protein n=1 Tax=Pseudooceanicola sp. TaxID=1914328 RepID=UPI0035C6645D